MSGMVKGPERRPLDAKGSPPNEAVGWGRSAVTHLCVQCALTDVHVRFARECRSQGSQSQQTASFDLLLSLMRRKKNVLSQKFKGESGS